MRNGVRAGLAVGLALISYIIMRAVSVQLLAVLTGIAVGATVWSLMTPWGKRG